MNAPKSPAGHTKILTSGNVSPWRDNPNSPPIGYVAQKVDNPDSGLQAYVLTDEKTGTPPDKVTHVTVLYRGSNEPKDFLNPDRQAAESVLTGKPFTKPDPQYTDSAKLLTDTLRKYPNAHISIYGHSLGAPWTPNTHSPT